MTETKTFKCPSCGAPLAYDGADAKLTCAHCGAEIEPDAFLDEEDFDESAPRSWDKYGDGKADWSDSDVTLYTCPSCGGEIVCESNTSSTVCPRRTPLTVFSMSWPAASRREAEPLNTGVTKVLPVLSSSSLEAFSLIS